MKQTFSVSIEIKESRLYLAACENIGISTQATKLPSFLVNFESFKAKELSDWYQISSSNTSKYLKEWIDKGLISKSGHGGNTRYKTSKDI